MTRSVLDHASAPMRLSHGPRPSPDETLRRAVDLVDEQAGLIRLLYENPVDPDSPQFFGFASILADTARYGVEDFGLLNGSTALTRSQAAAGAIGEAVERYACRIVPYGNLIWDSYSKLGSDCRHPDSFVLYDTTQYEQDGFPYARFDESEEIAWVEAYSLTRNATVLVPATMVFMSTVDHRPRPMVQQTTNGLACGGSREAAILSGLYEVIERDASMLAWLSWAERPHLRIGDDNSEDARSCSRLYSDVRGGVDLVDISAGLDVPSVLAVAQLPDRLGGGPVFASAANLSNERAAVGALEELAQCLIWLKSLRTRSSKPSDPRSLKTPTDHVLWATEPQQAHHKRFLTAGAATSELPKDAACSGTDPLADIQDCVDRLASRDLEVLAVDITPPDVADVGLHVVRTLVPGAVPLYFGTGLWRINERVLAASGHTIGDGQQFNRLPHPFP